jgi:ADP-ribose pyrophosphatase YjhB (NUDIX family)
MELQVGVKILLRNREGRYLILRRSSAKYPEVSDRWDVAGGRIIPGTSLFDNLARELNEETQLEIVGSPELIAAQDIIREKNGSSRHVVRLTYTGSAEGTPILDDENDAYAWLSMKEIRDMPEGDLDKYFRELLESGLLDGQS